MARYFFFAIVSLLVIPVACSNPPPPVDPSSTVAPEQQRIVDRAAAAVRSMRENPRFGERMESFIGKARAVAVFPRLIKASVIFGGEGGNGVMVVRRADGSWSPPAFYSLGAASAGLQIGYQETSAVFFFMSDRTVQAAIDSDFRLGADASVAAGMVGDGGQAVSGIASDAIYTFTEVGGVYAGVSFDGHVMGPRRKHNQAYYGSLVTPPEILYGTGNGANVSLPPGSAAIGEALGAGATAPSPAPTPVPEPPPAETAPQPAPTEEPSTAP